LTRRERLYHQSLELRRRIGSVPIKIDELLDHRGDEVDA
jgi:hypothetical protein